MDKKRIWMYIFALIMGLVTFYTINFISSKNPNKIQFETIDFSLLKNGFYEGSFMTTDQRASVQITIHEGRLTSIILKDIDNDDKKTASLIFELVIEKQSLDVLDKSNKTIDSIVILKAIEQALLQAL